MAYKSKKNKPSAQEILSKICESYEKEEIKKARALNPRKKIRGPRASFLETLAKGTDFKSAYISLNQPFKKRVYNATTCLEWMGIKVKEEIISAYRKNLNRAEAYQKAIKINNDICGFEAISEQYVNTIIEEYLAELNKNNGSRVGADDAR